MNNHTFTIRQLGDPVLREVAKTVTDITDSHTQSFLDNLLKFVLTKKGMGIAAPQIGISQRIFIMSSRPNSRYPSAPEMKPIFVINPEIIASSTDLEKDWEACLSIPGIRALVPRHTAIKVKYTSQTGETMENKYSGFLARVFQHELDHLDGKVFLDHVEDSHDIMMEQEWLKLFSQT